MNWYFVKLIFQIVNGKSHLSQFDEQWRLVLADEADWALEKARVLGWLEQTQFADNNNHLVKWKFIEVTGIQKLQALDDGALLCSFTQVPANCEEYLEIIKTNAAKSRNIKLNSDQLST